MRRNRFSEIYWGLVFIVVGVILLAKNLGYLDFHFSLRLYWPILLVLIGLGWIIASFETDSTGRSKQI
ncbi:MAG: DUF5668 domain-containing protein [Bacteroidota bacterium]|mgnify:CR=1 FL=1